MLFYQALVQTNSSLKMIEATIATIINLQIHWSEKKVKIQNWKIFICKFINTIESQLQCSSGFFKSQIKTLINGIKNKPWWYYQLYSHLLTSKKKKKIWKKS